METPEPNSPAEPERLKYAPPAHWHERPAVRKTVRAVFVVGVVAIAALLLWATGRRMFMLHYQKQAMTFVAPPEQIAFTNDPTEAARLLQSGGSYIAGTNGSGTAMFSIPALRRLAEIENEHHVNGHAFSHVRQADGGSERLVKVSMPYLQTSGSPALTLEPRLRPIFTPTGVNERLRAIDLSGSDSLRVDLHPADRFRLFVGQPDLKDAAHFTFAYELNAETGTIDGWLMNDDTVKLEPRDGPLRNRFR